MQGEPFWRDERFMSMLVMLVWLMFINFARHMSSSEFIDLTTLMWVYGGFQSAAFSGTRVFESRAKRAAAENGHSSLAGG